MLLEDDCDIDELAMSASALLIQYRKRGINDDTERRVLNNTHDARNLERLRVLIAKFEATIQAHDAEVAAAHTALVAHASHDAHVHTHKTFGVASSSAHASSCSTSSGATEGIQGNAEGCCTITRPCARCGQTSFGGYRPRAVGVSSLCL